MDFLDWRILIGVAVFIAGWMLGRVDMDQVVASARAVPAKVSAGIAGLLQGQRAAAAGLFLEAAQPLSPSNAELHFIAAQLYRDCGDHEAAIRVHKQLLATVELPAAAQARARYELGLDYQRAGFIDLAQECFRRMDGTEYSDLSIRHLFDLHLYSKNWKEAIDNEQRFAAKDGTAELRRHIIAQLYCEWASTEEPARCAQLLAEAQQRNPDCGRVWLMQAQLQLAAGEAEAALATLAPVTKRTELLPLAAELILQAYQANDDLASGVALLQAAVKRAPSLLLFAKVYEALANHVGADKLTEFTELGLRELSGVVPVSRWLATARRTAPADRRASYEQLYETLGTVHVKFRCHNCDFQSRTHHWQCPACRQWETMLAPSS